MNIHDVIIMVITCIDEHIRSVSLFHFPTFFLHLSQEITRVCITIRTTKITPKIESRDSLCTVCLSLYHFI